MYDLSFSYISAIFLPFFFFSHLAKLLHRIGRSQKNEHLARLLFDSSKVLTCILSFQKNWWRGYRDSWNNTQLVFTFIILYSMECRRILPGETLLSNTPASICCLNMRKTSIFRILIGCMCSSPQAESFKKMVTVKPCEDRMKDAGAEMVDVIRLEWLTSCIIVYVFGGGKRELRSEVWRLLQLSFEFSRTMKSKPPAHVSDVYPEPDTHLVVETSLWSAGRQSRFGLPNVSSG